MDWKFWAGIAVGLIGIGVTIIGKVNRKLGIVSMTIGVVLVIASIFGAFSNPAPTAQHPVATNDFNSQAAPPLHEQAKTSAMPNSSPSTFDPPPSASEHTTPKNFRFEESLARIKVKLRSGMSYEQLVLLLDEARVAKSMTGDIAPVQIRQFSCYEELESLWSQKTPNALLQRGIVSNWEEAKREYSLTEEPIIYKKFAECYSF
jgi:hypothetical protein